MEDLSKIMAKIDLVSKVWQKHIETKNFCIKIASLSPESLPIFIQVGILNSNTFRAFPVKCNELVYMSNLAFEHERSRLSLILISLRNPDTSLFAVEVQLI